MNKLNSLWLLRAANLLEIITISGKFAPCLRKLQANNQLLPTYNYYHEDDREHGGGVAGAQQAVGIVEALDGNSSSRASHLSGLQHSTSQEVAFFPGKAIARQLRWVRAGVASTCVMT